MDAQATTSRPTQTDDDRVTAALARCALLTRREIEVLQLAADGVNGPEIAERLVVSASTVKTHFENVYRKLRVPDRPAAVAQALRAGVID